MNLVKVFNFWDRDSKLLYSPTLSTDNNVSQSVSLSVLAQWGPRARRGLVCVSVGGVFHKPNLYLSSAQLLSTFQTRQDYHDYNDSDFSANINCEYTNVLPCLNNCLLQFWLNFDWHQKPFVWSSKHWRQRTESSLTQCPQSPPGSGKCLSWCWSWRHPWQRGQADVPNRLSQCVWTCQICPAFSPASKSNSPPGAVRLMAQPLTLPK